MLTNLGCPSDCGLSHNDNWACCSEECPCLEGEGDCDSDSDCKASLSCHDSLDNCGAEFPEGFDCCAPITTTMTTTKTTTTTTTTTSTTETANTTIIGMFVRTLNIYFFCLNVLRNVTYIGNSFRSCLSLDSCQ